MLFGQDWSWSLLFASEMCTLPHSLLVIRNLLPRGSSEREANFRRGNCRRQLVTWSTQPRWRPTGKFWGLNLHRKGRLQGHWKLGHTMDLRDTPVRPAPEGASLYGDILIINREWGHEGLQWHFDLGSGFGFHHCERRRSFNLWSKIHQHMESKNKNSKAWIDYSWRDHMM